MVPPTNSWFRLSMSLLLSGSEDELAYSDVMFSMLSRL